MSDQHGQLTVNVRTQRGKGIARKLRRDGLIPGVLYGRGVSGGDSVMLSLSPLELQRAMDPQKLQNTFFQLTLKQEGKPDVVQPCIIADAQRDAIRDDFLHVDFLRVDPEQPVTMTIPVEYVGRAAGVAAGGRLKTLRRFVRIAAKPGQVPVSVKVDVTPLQAGEALRFRDVVLENAAFAESPDVTIAVIETVKAATEEKPEEAKPAT